MQPTTAADAINRLKAISPFYSQLLEQNPDYASWLSHPVNLEEPFRQVSFEASWRGFCGQGEASFDLDRLRRFRRKMMLRIACREVAGIARPEQGFEELTLLASFVVGELLRYCYPLWERRLGTPMCEESGKVARFCVLGLGKFGGRELNFFSDLDLIYVYEGNGPVLKDGRESRVVTQEFFNRFFRDFSGLLTEHNEHGHLYNLDLRLRPEGDSGPIARSFAATANYYYTAGQTWERLALIRARPVGGATGLGLELLEELNPFRYPRFPSPNILNEVSGVKIRTEKELVGEEKLELDVKSGKGGIREIEFVVQAFQITQGGGNPFLQTHSTLEALEKLERYGLLPAADCRGLREAYLFLRLVENRLQIRQESRCHQLPPPGTAARDALAASLGFADTASFDRQLDETRGFVRRHYRDVFEESESERNLQEWTLFLGGHPASPEIQQKLTRWFPESEDVDERLRGFILGNSRHLVTREQVNLFLDVAESFDAVLPTLSRPLQSLERVARFAESYGARKQFFKAAANPGLFKALGRLFDRSTFIFELLCKHPGIMEELLHEAPRRQKNRVEIEAEIKQLPREDSTFPHFLWLYVKAEQVRLAMGEALHDMDPEITEAGLTELADAAVQAALDEVDPESRLAVVALGKYGGHELSFGSDLDVIILAPDGVSPTKWAKTVAALLKILQHNEAPGPAFEVDARLRPHGQDGPYTVTLAAFERYHTEGHAQLWEKQLLTRARAAVGNEQLLNGFVQLRDRLIYKEPAQPEWWPVIWNMRLKIEQEKTRGNEPLSAFKSASGGLLDIEFLAQCLQLAFGSREPRLRVTNTREVLRRSRETGHLTTEVTQALLRNYSFIRDIERFLRRINFSNLSSLPEDGRDRNSLALWCGFADWDAFYRAYALIFEENRLILRNFFRDSLGFSTESFDK